LRFNPVTSSALATRTLGAGDEYEFFFKTVDPLMPDEASPSPLLDKETYDEADFADTWARAALASFVVSPRRRATGRGDEKKRGRYSDGAFGWEVRFARGQVASASTTPQRPLHRGQRRAVRRRDALGRTRIGVPARVRGRGARAGRRVVKARM
jgi:hypothetical protein